MRLRLRKHFGDPNENFTYVLFTDSQAQQKLEPLIQKTFADLKVGVKPWSFKNRNGLIIQMSMDDASMKVMDPGPDYAANAEGSRLPNRCAIIESQTLQH